MNSFKCYTLAALLCYECELFHVCVNCIDIETIAGSLTLCIVDLISDAKTIKYWIFKIV